MNLLGFFCNFMIMIELYILYEIKLQNIPFYTPY